MYQLSKAVVTNLSSIITSANFSQSFSISGDGRTVYDWNCHQDLLAVVENAGFIQEQTSVVLNPVQYHKLVTTLPGLAGVNVTDVLKSGFVDYLGGCKIYRSTVIPAGCVGYIAMPQAIAVAWRIIPVPDDYDGKYTYLTSDMDDANGIALTVRRFTLKDVPEARMQFDCVYGMAVADPNRLIRILN